MIYTGPSIFKRHIGIYFLVCELLQFCYFFPGQSLFPLVQITISQYRFRLWLGSEQATSSYLMKTSSNGNIFSITGPLCGKFIGHRWIPLTNASGAELWSFPWSAPEETVEQSIETRVIWDAIAPIMTSLQCGPMMAQFTNSYMRHSVTKKLCKLIDAN